MKLKGSLNSLSAKKVIALFVSGGALFFGLRIYQTLSLIDPQTGFFTDKENITVPLFYALAAALAIITPILLYLTPLSRAAYIEPKENVFHAVCCFGLGLGAAYSAYITSKKYTNEKDLLVLIILSALSAVVLIANAVGFFTNGKLVQKLKIPNLIPVLWAMLLTVSNFNITSGYLANTLILINIFADAFLMLFLFQYAKKFSGINGSENSPIFIYSGLICSLFEITAFAASVISVFVKHATSSFTAFAPYRLFAALFSVSALIIMLNNKVPDAPEIEDEDEEVIETEPFAPMEEENADENTNDSSDENSAENTNEITNENEA